MVHSDYFVYESANFNPRIKVLLFLDSAQGGLIKNVGVFEPEIFMKRLCSRFFWTPYSLKFSFKSVVHSYHLKSRKHAIKFISRMQFNLEDDVNIDLQYNQILSQLPMLPT